ncbi:MAG: hypothetical protein ABFS37_12695 [Acidobacteriota bacterium]
MDNTSDCRAMPEVDRTFFPDTIHWNNDELLIHSTGNDLSIWNIQDPAIPAEVANSDFQVGNLGDSDYDLLAWTACDDCRYGVATFKLGTVAFDLGTEAIPSFQNSHAHFQYPQLDRTMTFSHQGHQYLVAGGIQNACGNGAGLFLFNGTDLDSLQLLECLEGSGGAALGSGGGLYLQHPELNEGNAYIWLNVGLQVHIFRIGGAGDGLSLTYVATPPNMVILRTDGLSVDLDNKVAITVGAYGTTELKTWQLLSLENPVQVGSLTVQGTIASLKFPLVWLAQFSETADGHSSHTVDISDPSAPQLKDDQFWSGDNPWNDLPCWGGEMGGVFSEDGSYLFLSRWEQLQKFDFRQCLGDPSIIFVGRFETGDSSEWSTTTN